MSRFDVDDDSDHDDSSSGGLANRLPTEPPFLAFLHGIKEDVNEQLIRDFFGGELEVVNVTIAKGDGKVEFKDRDTLARALFYSGRLLQGREVKVELPGAPKLKPLPPAPPASTGGGGGSGNGTSNNRATPSSSSSGGGGRGGDRDGRGGGRGGGGGGGSGRGGYNFGRDSRDGSGEGGRGGGRGGRSYRGGDRDERRDGPRPNIFGKSRDTAPPSRRGAPPPGEGGENKEEDGADKPQRPRLQLKPRSKPLDAEKKDEADTRKPSIFGGGKAHDELEFQKKWQEHHKDEVKLPGAEGEDGEAVGPTGSRYSIRGDRTKAVDGVAPDGHSRVRSGSFGSSRKEGPGGRGAAGGRGGVGGPGGRGGGRSSNSTPKPKKAPVGDDEWQEVEHSASAEKFRAKRVGEEGEEGEEKAGPTRAVGGAFAALNLLDESDED